MSVHACHLIDLPRIRDARGNLTFVEGLNHVPFDIRRVYYLYGMPRGSERGGHAHQRLEQLLVAVSGSFTVVLDDGTDKVHYHLSRSYAGLYIAPMVWRHLHNFSQDAVCLVLASAPYDESDYFRDYDSFRGAVHSERWETLLHRQ